MEVDLIRTTLNPVRRLINAAVLRNLTRSLITRARKCIQATRYKPVGRGFDSRWCHWNFSVT